jgi:hypothetical protein
LALSDGLRTHDGNSYTTWRSYGQSLPHPLLPHLPLRFAFASSAALRFRIFRCASFPLRFATPSFRILRRCRIFRYDSLSHLPLRFVSAAICYAFVSHPLLPHLPLRFAALPFASAAISFRFASSAATLRFVFAFSVLPRLSADHLPLQGRTLLGTASLPC